MTSALQKPSYVAQIVDRERLYRSLDRWQTVRMIVVHGPAGYGKSSLVSRWLDVRAIGDRAAWLALDDTSLDPRQFLRELASSLESLTPGAAERIGPTLDDLLTPPPLAAVRLARAVDGLNGTGPEPRDRVLIIDNAHALSRSPSADLLNRVVEAAPPWLHFVVLSRHVRDLPLARLISAGDALDIGADELRFSRDELREFLALHDVAAPDASLGAILDRTAGWPVALRLALHAARPGQPLAEYLATLRGDGRWLAWYLAQEVLVRQSPDMRAFLLRSSILDTFSESLVAYVTGADNTAALVSELLGGEMFLTRFDSDGAWYRFHDLVLDCLRRALAESEGASMVRALHRRAAEWLVAHDQPLPAIGHYLEADDTDSAAAVAEERVRGLLLTDSVLGVRLLDAIPAHVARRRPRLMLDRCFASLLNRSENIVALTLNAQRAVAEQPATDVERRAFERELKLYQAASHIAAGEPERVVQIADELRDERHRLDRPLAALLDFMLAHALKPGTEFERARAHCLAAMEAFQSVGFEVGRIAASRQLATILFRAGRADDARRELEREIRQYPDPRGRQARELLGVHYVAADQHYAQNRLEDARREVELARQCAVALDDRAALGYLECLRGLCAARADGSDASAASVPEPGEPTNQVRFVDWHIRWLVACSRPEAAWSVAEAYAAGLPHDLMRAQYTYLLPYLRAYVARGRDLTAILPLMVHALDGAVDAGDLPAQVEALVLKAWLEAQIGSPDTPDTLSRARALSQSTGFTRALLDVPALASIPTPSSPNGASDPRLTRQEQHVLELLEADWTYADIATALFVSVNTVRTHVRNLYRKLGAHRRDQAVQRARRTGLTSERADS